MRRQRIRGSPSTLTHSNVARPSGPENDQVISQISVPWTRLTRNFLGQASPRRLICRSQAGEKSSLATLWNSAYSSSDKRRMSPSNWVVHSNFN